MMAIYVKLAGNLKNTVPDGEMTVSLPQGATVATLLAILGIAASEEHLVSRNSLVVDPSTSLSDGDRVSIRILVPQ